MGSLVILVSYYVLITTFEGMALRDRMPPWLAIWTPNLLFAAIGAGFLVATAIEWRLRGIHLFWRERGDPEIPVPGDGCSLAPLLAHAPAAPGPVGVRVVGRIGDDVVGRWTSLASAAPRGGRYLFGGRLAVPDKVDCTRTLSEK